jgi:hypothetical protein
MASIMVVLAIAECDGPDVNSVQIRWPHVGRLKVVYTAHHSAHWMRERWCNRIRH